MKKSEIEAVRKATLRQEKHRICKLLREKGCTYAFIGELYGLKMNRVRCIVEEEAHNDRIAEAKEEERREGTLTWELYNLGLRHWVRHVLDINGIKTIPELAAMDPKEVRRVPRVGRTALKDVQDKLQEEGLTLGMPIEEARSILSAAGYVPCEGEEMKKESTSPLYCPHANETPGGKCSCPDTCYCRAQGNCYSPKEGEDGVKLSLELTEKGKLTLCGAGEGGETLLVAHTTSFNIREDKGYKKVYTLGYETAVPTTLTITFELKD